MRCTGAVDAEHYKEPERAREMKSIVIPSQHVSKRVREENEKGYAVGGERDVGWGGVRDPQVCAAKTSRIKGAVLRGGCAREGIYVVLSGIVRTTTTRRRPFF